MPRFLMNKRWMAEDGAAQCDGEASEDNMQVFGRVRVGFLVLGASHSPSGQQSIRAVPRRRPYDDLPAPVDLQSFHNLLGKMYLPIVINLEFPKPGNRSFRRRASRLYQSESNPVQLATSQLRPATVPLSQQ